MQVSFTLSTATLLHVFGGAVVSAGVAYLQHKFHFRLTKGEVATAAKLVEALTPPQIDVVVEAVAKIAEVVVHDAGSAPGLVSL